MNCANHPERTATAFCQNCGKALCPECTRTADGLLLCEPCYAARAATAAPGATGAPWTTVPPAAGRAGYTPVPGGAAPLYPANPPGSPSPFLAGLLGFIPGVGAMYNGQFIKGLIHVVVFIVLVGMVQHWWMASLLIAAWEFYQVFDAAQTAAARRDGRPLPDPLGLLDLSGRLGPAQPRYGTPPHMPPPAARTYAAPAAAPGAAQWTQQPPPATPGGAQWTQEAPPPPADPASWIPQSPAAYPAAVPPPRRRGGSFGAIALIVLGVLFLLNTLDVLNFDWIGRGWPLLLLALGVWMLIRRQSGMPTPAGQVPPAPAPYTAPPASGASLSISPYSGASPTRHNAGDTPGGSEEEK